MTNIDKFRSLTIGKPRTFKSETVPIDGTDFEVRQPTIKQRGTIQNKALCFSDDAGKRLDVPVFKSSEFQVWAVIEMTHIPGTDQRVFSEKDYDILVEQPAGGWFDTLSKKAMELANVDETNTKKPSVEIKKE
jgi:hypothetical protein